MGTTRAQIPASRIAQSIHLLRGQRVMLSRDLAELYGVPVKVLNQAVKRHVARFPADFVFQLTAREFENLKSQFVTSSWGGIRRARPFAFFEQGGGVVFSVLNNSPPGGRTRPPCWRGRPRPRGLVFLRNTFFARRPKKNTRRAWFPIPNNP